MFVPAHWAEAFVNSLEKAGGEIEEGLETFTLLASLLKSAAGGIAGRSGAEKLELLIRGGMEKAGLGFTPAQETAARFFLLMIKKGAAPHCNSVIEETKKLMDKKNGVVRASAEFAFEPDELFGSRLCDAVKKRTGAARVELTKRLNPALIGGYRLRIGDELIDASVRSQLRKLENSLDGGYT